MVRMAAAALLVASSVASAPTMAADAALGAVQVVPMGPVQPQAAPDQSLYLVRYVIAPHTTLALHHHEGTQIGLVVSGNLTYSVVRGAVPVFHAGADGKPARIDVVTSGERRVINPGQWVVETADDVHSGANLGDEPLVIFTSSLLRKGAPLATPVQP
jgi:quercetin dioxygenase-like cupin family protein